jgi:hypothetical protein
MSGVKTRYEDQMHLKSFVVLYFFSSVCSIESIIYIVVLYFFSSVCSIESIIYIFCTAKLFSY